MRFSLCLCALSMLQAAPLALAQEASGPSPADLLSALPAAWEGYARQEPQFEEAPSYAGGLGEAAARYSSTTGTQAAEYSFRITEMGEKGGRMYRDYGADYLKGPVKNETQQSVEILGLPALLTMTSETSLMVETYLEPSLHLEVHCIRSSAEDCLAAAGRFDLAALQLLAAKGASK